MVLNVLFDILVSGESALVPGHIKYETALSVTIEGLLLIPSICLTDVSEVCLLSRKGC